MKYLLAADLHGKISAFETVKEIACAEKPEAVILLGDLLGYSSIEGTNRVLKQFPCKIYAVRGNCDGVDDFNQLELCGFGDSFTLPIGGRNYFFTHGHIYGFGMLPPVMKEGDVIMFGHYHMPEIATYNGVTRVCVGSIARPRKGSPCTYCTVDENKITVIDADSGEIVAEKVF